MKNLPWIVSLILAIILILVILFQPKPPEVDITPYEIQIAEQNLIIDSLSKSNRARLKRIQEDSIIQAEERASFLERYTRLKGKLGQQRVRIDTVIRENPQVARYVELADSTIQVQAERIDTLESNLTDLRVNMKALVNNFNSEIAAHISKYENEKAIADHYQKENRKTKRANRLWKSAAVVGTVGAFLLGGQL
jgi:hypothetical protein